MNYEVDWKRVGELQQALVNKYPKLLGKHGWPGVGEGWLPIVDKLCADIQANIDATGCEQVEVLQIKEKFGGLRFYTGPATPDHYTLIRSAENEASKTCDVCGAPGGKLRTDGWMVTRCDEHV